MLLRDLYEQQIKPKFPLIREMLTNGESEADIRKEIGVNPNYWRLCKISYSEFVQMIEEVKGPKSDYYLKIQPFFEKIEEWISKGIPDREIAFRLEVSVWSYKNYKKIYPEFGEFVLQCKELTNGVVIGAMFRMATGFDYEEKKESIEEGEILYDKDTGEPKYHTNADGTYKLKDGKKVPKRKPGKIKVERMTKHSTPNVAAGTLWLTNKDSENWSVRNQTSHFIDPSEAARKIRDEINDMDDTVPNKPVYTPSEAINSKLSELSKEELVDLKRQIDGIVEK